MKTWTFTEGPSRFNGRCTNSCSSLITRSTTSPIRFVARASPGNIAEGYARRRSVKEFCSFLALAVGSANEMEVHLKTAHHLGYITEEEFEYFRSEYEIVGRQLTRLIQY